MKPEIVIIGSGVIGASVAFHLSARGVRKILILERDTAQGLGSTGRATGGVRSQFETAINIRMSQYSIDFFENCGFDCGYEPRGYLFFATRKSELEYLTRNVEKQRSLGVKGVEIVGPGKIAEIVPGLNCADIIGGSFGRTDGFIDPLAVMRGFTEKAIADGAEMRFATEVLAIKVKDGRVRALETNRGTIECSKVIVCAGAWAGRLARTAGIDLPITPLRRQIVWAKSRKILPENLPMVIDLGSGFHFRPAKDVPDEILFAYPDRNEPSSFNTGFDRSFIPRVYERAAKRAEFLADSVPILEKCRAGLYEVTPDHHAVLGGCEIAGLYFAVGFSGHGVMHSPAAGRALAEIVLDGRAGFLDVAPLGLERFARNELLHETAFI